MIPKQLQNDDFRFCLVEKDGKRPIENEWTTKNNYKFNNHKVIEHIKKGGNLGILGGYGGLVIVDFDDKEFQKDRGHQFIASFAVKTATKGLQHKYFIVDEPKSFKVGNKADVQGPKRMVLCPPSQINGKKYEVFLDKKINNISMEKIEDILIDKKNKQKNKVSYNKIMKGQDRGNRNNSLFKLACSLKSRGVGIGEVMAAVETANSKNNPPLPNHEVQQIITSAYSYKDNMVKGQLHISNYLTNVEDFHSTQPFFYDKSKIFWFWNHELYKYEIVDETDLMRFLDRELGFCGQTISSSVRSNYIEAFKRVGRERHPLEAKKKWIQFKNKAYSLSGKIHNVTPDYFFTNPIPWDIGKNSETPTMDRLFEEWVGKDYVKTLYEIIAYCCYRDYPIQLLFSLCGSGRNGKSQYLKIIDKFIGKDNTVSTELDRLLENRFESFKLYKKLVCIIGETNFSVLEQSSMLKKLTGGDKIGYEKKNKDPFDDYNYAKPIIASNSLPSSSDTSEGFYRRWLIIDFPNEFEENGHDIIDDIPDKEYNALAKKVTEILPEVLKKGKFTNQGTISERKKRYIEQSNPLQNFLNKHCKKNEDSYILYSRLYTHYINYLAKHKKRKVKMKEFKNALEDEGLFVEKDNKKIGEDWKSGYYVQGICFLDNLDNLDNNSTLSPFTGKFTGGHVQIVQNVTDFDRNTIKFDEKTIIRYINTHQFERDNKQNAERIFGEEVIQILLRKGEIIEIKPNQLKVL